MNHEDPSIDGTGIVLLAGEGESTNIVYHALKSHAKVTVVIEGHVPRAEFLRRRIKRLGPKTVIGQVFFQGTIPIIECRLRRSRRREIISSGGLNVSPIDAPIRRIPSVNSEDARTLLRALDPSVVVINGTRIISGATLDSVSAQFINMHAGITPQYRGVHGAYWALHDGRPDLVGTTVHLVDTGIDTGNVIGQAHFAVTNRDSFATYPLLHIKAGLPLLLDAAQRVLRGEKLLGTEPATERGPSRLTTHPTLWGYLTGRYGGNHVK